MPRSQVPRRVVRDVVLKPGETLHISLLSDLHLESSLCDIDGLKATMKARADLQNHRALAFGDVLDLVSNRDLRRYRRGGQISEIAAAEAWVDETIEHATKVLLDCGVKWDVIATGNHEYEWLRRHGTDVTSVLAKNVGAARGGYSGWVDYRIKLESRAGRIRNGYNLFRVVYHHGAWGGKYAKGYLGAKDWAFRVQAPWHVFAFGHCHASRVDPEEVFVETNGGIDLRTVYIVNCSSWVHALDLKNAAVVHYTERRGYVPQPRKAPLVRVRPVLNSGKVRLEYSVEV